MRLLSKPLRPGDRIRIRALSDFGSARLLDGLTGEVVGAHPVANGWYKIRLDANGTSPHAEWSAPGDRLVREGDPHQANLVAPKGVKHFP